MVLISGILFALCNTPFLLGLIFVSLRWIVSE
jgi:hypothetical protein